MRVSASIELIVQLAAREAIGGSFKEILPEHVLNALLKFAEFPAPDIEKLVAEAAVRQMLVSDVHSVREALDDRFIDSTAARRTLRQKMGKGTCPYAGGDLHRSAETRQLFDATARLADKNGSETLTPIHLLEAIFAAPTPMITEVLESISKAEAARCRTPLLDEHGRDLRSVPADKELPGTAGRRGELSALAAALTDGKRPCIVLVSEGVDAVRALLLVLVRPAAEGATASSLGYGRVVEISSISGLLGNQKIIAGLAEELARVRRTVLFVPLNAASAQEPAKIRTLFQKTNVRCILWASPDVYREYIEHDAVWTECARMMWIRAETCDSIPEEL